MQIFASIYDKDRIMRERKELRTDKALIIEPWMRELRIMIIS
jgi:hypothetical protein